MVISINRSPIINSYGFHKHNEYELIYVIEGEMNVTISEKDIYMKKGDLLTVPPAIVHGGTSGTNYRDIFIKTDDFPFSEPILIHEYDDSIYQIFKLIEKLHYEQENNYSAIADKLLSAIAEYVKKYEDTKHKYPFVSDIKNKIFKNIHNSAFSISEEVKRIGYNTDYFRRCFKEEVGCTPIEYLTKLRLQKAEGLLKDLRYNGIGIIAEQCGYDDYFYFSRSFKERYGISPREYRKAYIESCSTKGVGKP